MRTYSHLLLTWVVARYGVRIPRRASLAAAAGSGLPDLSAFAGVAALPLGGRWAGMPDPGPDHDRLHEQVLDRVFFTGPFGTTGIALHSVVPVALLLLACAIGRTRGREAPKTMVWFLFGWVGHVVVDFLTHADDARPPLWPVSDWR